MMAFINFFDYNIIPGEQKHPEYVRSISEAFQKYLWSCSEVAHERLSSIPVVSQDYLRSIIFKK